MKTILLSFDIEEFDVPCEYGVELPLEKQIDLSRQGLLNILEILDSLDIKACFYSTVVFASENQSLIKRMSKNGHEIASHGYFHKKYTDEDLLLSKLELEKICESSVYGFRKPQMQAVDSKLLAGSGYTYNSSLNPTYLPGRYNHFRSNRLIHRKQNLYQLPVSVTPFLRLPLFWLSFHNLPMSIYKHLCKKTINKDFYVHLYFHPWEFIELSEKEKFNLPKYISRNTGASMINRFKEFLIWAKKQKYQFSTTIDFIHRNKQYG